MAAIFDLDEETPGSVFYADSGSTPPIQIPTIKSTAAPEPEASPIYGSTPRAPRLGKSYEVEFLHNYSHKHKKKVPEDFEQLKVLGAGAYGKVYLARDRTSGKLYAQKQLKKCSIVVEDRRMEQTMSERSILEAVRHPYIVKLYYAIQDFEKCYLMLEYAQGGELFTHLATERMLSEDVAAFYVAQIASALCHLHSVGVVYRDLKPENCLLDVDGNLLLTDFGLSKVAEDGSTCNSLLGTPEYMAPEILLGQDYDSKVDWWSLGALMYDLLTGNPPFTGTNHKKIIDKITKQKLALPYYLSADAKDLLIRLLRKEPERRLYYKQIDIIRKHRFFRKLNWKHIDTKSPELDPPIKPIITDPVLAENFSAEFTEMLVSPPGDERFQSFKGFSYVGSIDTFRR